MNIEEIEYRFINTEEREYVQEKMLRSKILREPLGLPLGAEIFPFEAEALHLIALNHTSVVGCVMFHAENDGGRLLQMAVANEFQGMGIGRELMKSLEKKLREDNFSEIHLHARIEAIPFYKKLGYFTYGEAFEEVGIEHRLMKKLIGKN